MRKTGLLHGRLLAVVAELGHTDTVVIADVGLPLPPGMERIDLALVPSVPGMLQTVRAVLASRSPALRAKTLQVLEGLPVRSMPHSELEQLTASARAVVRTGETTPYANVELVAGVTF